MTVQVLTVVGARPQFIKAGTVSRALQARGVSELIVHTGQHFDANMSAIFFDELDIPKPASNLEIGGGTHGEMTGRQLERVEAVLLNVRPQVVMVYGDTNSTLAGALAAAKLGIPVAHVEAGLRSWNRAMPEEINRVLTDHVSDIAYAPTATAVRNLLAEGIDRSAVHQVGDVMYDAALFYRDKGRRPALPGLPHGESFVLCTVHRPQNTEDPRRLQAIIEGLVKSGRQVVWPVHPRTVDKLDGVRDGLPARIHLIPPVGYLEMVWLEAHCDIVATDSGGVQKEAFFHGKPCVTFREETEWVELVEGGSQRLTGADPSAILEALDELSPPSGETHPYGTGDAAQRIAGSLAELT
jgi:UDP-GlcNAc3NAcA epimerase